MQQLDKNYILTEALNFHHQGKLEEADHLYCKVLDVDKNNFQANHLHGCILSQKSKYSEAISFLEKAARLSPLNYEANNNLALAYKNVKNISQSEKYYLNAIKIDKNNYKAYFNCANLYIDEKRYDEALEFLKESLLYNSNLVSIPHRIGEVYQYIFQNNRDTKLLESSREYFQDDIKCDKNHANSYIMLGITHLWLSNINEANKFFNKASSLNNYNNIFINNYIKKYLSDSNLLITLIKHEFEQLTYIDNDTDDIRNTKFTKKYYDDLKQLYLDIKYKRFNADKISLTFKRKLFKQLYNKPPKIIPNNLLNKANKVSVLENEYLNSNPEILVIDNLLNLESLNILQKFCNNANIFKYPYQGGYVSTFLTKGLSNEFILKFSEDLRETYKNIFKEFRLTQAWVFKHENKKEGTNIHADQASVNVNFWISPNDANLNKNSGGLILWDKLPPADWSFKDYNSINGSKKIEKMLIDNNISKKVIPYKENRAVIFNSKLFHSTDFFDFKDTYENRRINITFLYD